jgi:hypothetical protein
MANPSASAVDRVDHCPPSHVLRPRAEESGDYAERGNHIHEFARRAGPAYLRGDTSEFALALSCVPLEYQATCNQLDFATALSDLTIVQTEPAYALDAQSGSVVALGNNIAREYAQSCQKLYRRDIGEFEFCSSLDVEAMHADGHPCATDWKSGMKNKSAADMWQMRIQCYCLAIKYDAAAVWARVVYIDEDGSVTIDSYLFSRMELDSVPGDLMAILARVMKAQAEIDAGLQPTVYPSAEICKYCPALRSCHAQTALVKAMLTDIDLEGLDVSGLTIGQVGSAWGKLKQYAQLAKKLEDSLKARLYQEGAVPADKGYEYRVTDGSKTSMDQDKARGLLVMLGATPEQMKKLNRTSNFPVVRRMKAQ